ncbi:hypothetical protein DFH09DRAFT_1278919 [Mycena vulgaris]|nr:hypothetical protein DFH09DRAFT_1278919 [Mycena vulgaris]
MGGGIYILNVQRRTRTASRPRFDPESRPTFRGFVVSKAGKSRWHNVATSLMRIFLEFGGINNPWPAQLHFNSIWSLSTGLGRNQKREDIYPQTGAQVELAVAAHHPALRDGDSLGQLTPTRHGSNQIRQVASFAGRRQQVGQELGISARRWVRWLSRLGVIKSFNQGVLDTEYAGLHLFSWSCLKLNWDLTYVRCLRWLVVIVDWNRTPPASVRRELHQPIGRKGDLQATCIQLSKLNKIAVLTECKLPGGHPESIKNGID